jgi:predicted Rossmann fold nucleotide-binding protein DprA/Smf involved in DNA uptake
VDSDCQAVVLLCSMIGRADSEPVRPLAPKEWSDLEVKIASSGLDGPGSLLGLTTANLARELEIESGEAERIAALVGRADQLDIELKRLADSGIAPLTRLDAAYPSRLRGSLKLVAPPVLFLAGARSLLNKGGIAVVGSRNIDESGHAFAVEIGRRCARGSYPLISGGARGTDAFAMQAAIEAGGQAVGVLADSLERAVRAADLREALEDGNLALITPYSPAASFTVGAAMGRNKLIYGMADYAVVVSSEVQKGGTWSGATDALKGRYCPVFVRTGAGVPEGNKALLKKGALEVPESKMGEIDDIAEWMKRSSGAENGGANTTRDGIGSDQPGLFD